ncbi:MAG: prepilin-type N-terminal cleavage/methylation domain-containing protein [Planctomycetes bacterium]|nr:prepilin-type N-terminal cleavage/methylation domain-containing protein [Planctomycetota bacterium]
MRRKGFTLIELLVVVAVIALLVTILLPSLGRARALAKRAACQSNLSSIAKALKLYGGEYNDSYPWICSDSDTTCNYNFRSDMNALVSLANFYTLIVSTDNETNCAENLNMLVYKNNMVSYKAYLCPASSANLYTGRGSNYGFLTTSTPTVQIQYGYHAGWKYSADNGVLNSAPLNENMSGDFIILGDMNPNKNTPYINLDNQVWTHGRNEGVNVLRANASVAWSTTVNADLGSHSIYMAGSTSGDDTTITLPVVPVDGNDSVLYVSGQ